MSFKDFHLAQTEVVQGICPSCAEKTMLISITREYYRCVNCGGDLKQYINGKISYIPTTDIQKNNISGEKV